MSYFTAQLKSYRDRQSGINMVDLMMWLVIAALLLASAIQGISYYQKAAFLHQMKSDLTGASEKVMGYSSMNGGEVNLDAVTKAVGDTKISSEVSLNPEASTNGGLPFIRAVHPSVEERDVIFLFEACSPYKIGVNVVPKDGNILTEDCGIGVSPEEDSDGTGDDTSDGAGDGTGGDGSDGSTDEPMEEPVADPDGVPGDLITDVTGTPYPYGGEFVSSRVNKGGTNVFATLNADYGHNGEVLVSHFIATCEKPDGSTYEVNRLVSITSTSRYDRDYTIDIPQCATDRVVEYALKPLTEEAKASGDIANPELFAGHTIAKGFHWEEQDGYLKAGDFASAMVNDGGTSATVVFDSRYEFLGKVINSQYFVTCERSDGSSYKRTGLLGFTSSDRYSRPHTVSLDRCATDRIIELRIGQVIDLGAVNNPETFVDGYSVAGSYSWSEATDGYPTAGAVLSGIIKDGGDRASIGMMADYEHLNDFISAHYTLVCERPDGSTYSVDRLGGFVSTNRYSRDHYTMDISGCDPADRIIEYTVQPVTQLGLLENPEGFDGYTIRDEISWSEAVDGYVSIGSLKAASVINGGTAVEVTVEFNSFHDGDTAGIGYSITCERSDGSNYSLSRMFTLSSNYRYSNTHSHTITGCGTDQVIGYSVGPVTDLGELENTGTFSGYTITGSKEWSV